MVLTESSCDAVMAWGLPQLRPLPWRDTRDPWAVLVSEVMLQQTQAVRVVPKWIEFMDRWPIPATCADAPLGEVLRQWQGLGYPRRARNLYATATELAAMRSFPSTLPGLLSLPGVGEYTARAVMAFAFELDVGVVDTNIARVLARVEGRQLLRREVQQLADTAVPAGDGWAWNQCLMELGAMVCRPVAPRCAACPLQRGCIWRGVGPDPAPGSAGVSRSQSRFEGSERQARGRLMRRLVVGSVDVREVGAVMAHPASARLVDDLCSEGLVVREGERLRLP